MKRWILILIIIALGVSGYSQDTLFVMHPLVGDTIDKSEKLNYFLFPDIHDSDFKYCTLSHCGENYYVRVHDISDSVTIQQIDSVELHQTIVRLDKVMAYYADQEKMDSIKNAKKLPGDLNILPSTHMPGPVLNESIKDKIFYEVRSTNRMKEDAERLEQRKQGNELLTGQGHIEFFKRRKKK